MELIGFVGGALVGALGMAAWLYERELRYGAHLSESVIAVIRNQRRLMMHARLWRRETKLRQSAPVRTVCENCGQATLTACTVPFFSTNSQN